MRIHIFGDQDSGATGAFYAAYGRALARACAAKGGIQPGVHYTYVELGAIENYPAKTADQIHAKSRPEDLVILVWDTEDRAPSLTARHLQDLKDALRARGIGEDRIHIVLIKPITEAVYLLDDAMLEVLVDFRAKRRQDSHRRPDGKRRRRAQTTGTDQDLRALAQRRRVYAKKASDEPPGKAEIYRTLALRDEHKALLAKKMAERLSQDYQLPSAGAVPVLDRLLDWLIASAGRRPK